MIASLFASIPLVIVLIGVLWIVTLYARYRQASDQSVIAFYRERRAESMCPSFIGRSLVRVTRIYHWCGAASIGLWMTLIPHVPATLGTLSGMVVLWSVSGWFCPKTTSTMGGLE